ncbi:probable crossover junction endonuclease EME2 [Tupaia chinensis]|uniref:probable crossover junction endonuclease EME2 n=1 Tax=Tupaia chinensis TaxID=246437 RepID=UPI000FFBF663|nr:probable crossover junction endonuclease EME2 [Tupaia chinensis]
MEGAGPGRALGSRRGRGQRRPPTWEVSDSDAEGPAEGSVEVGARPQGAAEERRTAAEALRPEQALRRLVVRVDPAILEDAGADVLLEALSDLGCEPLLQPQHPARSLLWSRVRPDPCPGGVPPEVWAADQELLQLLKPQEFLQSVVQLTQLSGPTCSVPWLSSESPARLHLAVVGLDAYLWSHGDPDQGKQWPQGPAAARAQVAIGWPEVEEALVLLQLQADADVLLVASWQELSQHVCAFTRAFAQRPFKRYQQLQAFPFCTAGRWASGERVARDGTGLRGVWWRQIRQLHRVSPAVADAVVTAFPCPRLLQQALAACSTEQERLGLLAHIPVKDSEGRRPRRVGPDLSRRICLLLTTTNPDLLLDLGS